LVTDEDIGFKFHRQIDYREHSKKCKIRSKGVVKGSRDLLFESKLETSNLALMWIRRGTNEKMQN